MKTIKRVLSLLLTVAIVLVMFTGCFSSSNPSDKNTSTNSTTTTPVSDNMTPYGRYGDTVTISIGRSDVPNSGLPKGETLENNAWTRLILDKYNIKVKMDWIVAGAGINQKIALALTSGDMPDVMIVNQQTLNQLIEADLITDMTDIYDKVASPSIKKRYASFLDNRSLKSAMRADRLMALPACFPGYQQELLWVRTDWLDNLKLQMPVTLEDVKNVALAFAKNDPDENGKADTFGIALDKSVMGNYNTNMQVNLICGTFGAYPRQWMKDNSGNVYYGSTTPEMKKSLTELASMFKAGIFDNDFVTRDQTALVAAGKIGMVFGPWWGAYSPLADSRTNNPNAKWMCTVAPLGQDGKVHAFTQDPSGGSYAVISKKCKNPEAVMKIINYQDDLKTLRSDAKLPYYDDKNVLSVNWTTMPIALQFSDENEVPTFAKKLWDAKASGDPSIVPADRIGAYNNFFVLGKNPHASNAIWGDVIACWYGGKLTNDPLYTFENPVFFSITKTMETKWAALAKMEDETFLKIIIGQEPIDYFDKFVADWKKLGGNEIIAEITKQLK